MSEQYHMHHSFYISTGALDARFTLRHTRSSGHFYVDSYVRNLADSEDLAESKALAYYEAFKERVGCPGVSFSFDGFETDQLRQRRGKLSVRDTESIKKIEAGKFPFGKYSGQDINNADDSYILYWVDQGAKTDSVIISALASVCLNIAMERDLLAKREAAKIEQLEQDLKSNFVGELGQRMVFFGNDHFQRSSQS